MSAYEHDIISERWCYDVIELQLKVIGMHCPVMY